MRALFDLNRFLAWQLQAFSVDNDAIGAGRNGGKGEGAGAGWWSSLGFRAQRRTEALSPPQPAEERRGREAHLSTKPALRLLPA